MNKLKPKLFSVMKQYNRKQFINDVIAGLIVAIIALPLSIALAISSGVTPEKGLHTAIIGGFIIAFLGGSRVQIGGPSGTFMVIVYGIVATYGMDGLIISTIMAGGFMILFGLFRLGSYIKFIPYPITTGFTSGIALVMFTSQIKDFLGLQIEKGSPKFLDQWKSYFLHIDSINFSTLGIGLIALLILIFWPKINRRIPGALIAIVITSALVNFLKLDVETIGGRFGELSSSIPSLRIPQIDLNKISMLIAPALTIAALGSIESLLSAVVSDGMIASKHRSNMELIADGTANIFSGLFGGIPVTGAIARTVANIKNGARTPIAGMVHSITLLTIMVLFMPLAKIIPLSALAAIIIMVAYNMSEWRSFAQLLKTPKSDVAVLLVTFSLTVLVDLAKAIEVGIIMAAFLFMKRMADVSNISMHELDATDDGEETGFGSDLELNNLEHKEQVQLYEINGPFFFGAADKFMDTLMSMNYHTKYLVIRMDNVPSIDATAIHSIKRLMNSCNHKGIRLIICGLHERPIRVLQNAGLYEKIGEVNFCNHLGEAVELINHPERKAV